ncbi:hypothetical protein M0R45_006999 [Rubus argutus]|uniref:Uncharacterized protein n=1 Tax=Rubus argutus TaxID=59490 RepID=A0AAW1YS33_RUBAR
MGSLRRSCRGSGVMTTAREIAADLGAAWLFWAEHGQEGSIDGGEHRRRRGLDEPAVSRFGGMAATGSRWAHGGLGLTELGRLVPRFCVDWAGRVCSGGGRQGGSWTARVMRTGVGWAGEHRPDEMMSELILNLVSSVLQVTAEDGFVVIEMLVN